MDCKDCLLEHAAAGDDVASALAVELAAAKMRIAELESALRPFAEYGRSIYPVEDDDGVHHVRVEYLRAAAAAMGGAR